MLRYSPTCCLLIACAALAPAQESALPDGPFPLSDALAEGIDPDALASLDSLIGTMVEEETIVGGELLVIKNGRTILHEAYGWRDKEAQVNMETGSVFCVRSMTKPFIAASIMMLVEEKEIRLGDPIAKYLPDFDAESTREITIEQLLTHTSGLSMSQIMSKDPRELVSIQKVAALGAGSKLEFTPGSDFNYSDQGTDTLTALIEVVSGISAADFVTTRLLEPLGMQDSVCVFEKDNPLRARGCVKYAGSPGSWTRFWGPDEKPLFPIFLGSQGLYSTLEDYARFTEMWRNRGRAREGRLLKSRSVRKVLAPGPHPMVGPTGLPGLQTAYGFLMQLWTGKGEKDEKGVDGEREVVAFGHTGSDGTHAWVFPKENAMVFYFTQSRGTTSGLRVEEQLGEIFLGVPFDANQAAPPLEEYLGYYWEGVDDKYRAIIRDGEDLALEALGSFVVPLTYIGEDRWKLRPNPGVVIEFDRSETGEVTGYHIGDHEEFRFTPGADLPSVEELAARVTQTHRIDLLETLGPLRTDSKLVMPKLNMEGELTRILAWPNRYRLDTTAGGNDEHVSFDGEVVRYGSSLKPTNVVEGQRAVALEQDSPFYRYANWLNWCPRARVIQVLERGGRRVALVRMGDTSAAANTLFVDLESARVIAEEGVVELDMMGRIGQKLRFGDYRDVSGMLLPFKVELEYANPMIGKITSTVTDYELGIEVPEGTFELKD